MIWYIRDQMNIIPSVDLAACPPRGQSTSNKPPFFSGQATPHSFQTSETSALIFKITKKQAKLH